MQLIKVKVYGIVMTIAGVVDLIIVFVVLSIQ